MIRYSNSCPWENLSGEDLSCPWKISGEMNHIASVPENTHKFILPRAQIVEGWYVSFLPPQPKVGSPLTKTSTAESKEDEAFN